MSAATATHELKSLQTRLGEVNANLAAVRQRRQDADNDERELLRLKQSLDAKIKSLTSKNVVVTEHAIIRYMERVYGIDLDQIKDEIVGCDHRTLKIPNGQFGVQSHRIRVKNGAVVTVLTDDMDND